jgi:pimeloyl-ACP methyl ester carboxylesterase
VRCVVNLEGFGLPRSEPHQAPTQMRRWLDQVKSRPTLKDYDSVEQLASIIRYRYPRFSDAQAAFVAAAWSTTDGGRVRMLGDSRHRWINPYRYHREDAEACWREVKAPMLMLLADESEYLAKIGADGGDAALRSVIPHLEIVHVAGAGHMLHIEKADVVAPLIEGFLGAH